MDQLSQIPQLVVSGITNGCVYAIVAIGFSIIYSSTQVINFAQGEFVMIGAMVAAVLLTKLSLVVALPVAVASGCLVGAMLALLILIPLKRASAISLVIITVGASIMFRGLAQLFWGEGSIASPPFTGVGSGASVEDRTFHFLGAVVQAQHLWVIAVTAILVIGMQAFFRCTLLGKAMRACAINKTGAQLVGISVRRMVVLSFVMAAGLGAVAGVTVAPIAPTSCNIGTQMGMKGFCAAVFGGLGNFGGGVVAGIVLGVVESISCIWWSQYKDAIAFVILLAVLCIKPQGLLARKRAGA